MDINEKCDFHQTNGGECNWCNKVIVENFGDGLIDVPLRHEKSYADGIAEGRRQREAEIFETLNRMAIAFDYGTNESVIMVRVHLKKCLKVDWIENEVNKQKENE